MAYNTSMLEMIEKVRVLVEDFGEEYPDLFTYEGSNVFTISESNVDSIKQILINGSASGFTYVFDSDTNTVTITYASFATDDNVLIKYDYTKYSQTEIYKFIKAAIVWLNVYSAASNHLKVSSTGLIIPEADEYTKDLICVIAAILIKPDYISYKTNTMAVTYPQKLSKEEKIGLLVKKLKSSSGVVGIIEFDTKLL